MRQVEDHEQDRRTATDRDRHRGAARQQRRQHELDQRQVGDADPGQGRQSAPAGHQEQQPREKSRDHPQRGVADEVVELVLPHTCGWVGRPAGDPDPVAYPEARAARAQAHRAPGVGAAASATDAVPHTAARLLTGAPAGPVGVPRAPARDC